MWIYYQITNNLVFQIWTLYKWNVLFIFPQHADFWSSSMLAYIATIYFHCCIQFMNKLQLTFLSTDIWVNFFSVWNNIGIKIIVQISCVRISLGYILRRGIAGLQDTYFFNFIWNPIVSSEVFLNKVVLNTRSI